MKVINLDELELKCIEFGIKNNFWEKEDLKDKNLFTINLNGRYHSKTCDIWLNNKGESIPLNFKVESWEYLYYELGEFFRSTWDYYEDENKKPLYMKIAELIGKQSKGGFVCAGKINEEIRKLL